MNGRPRRITIPRLYLKLRSRFGFRNWWPGDTPDEIFIGAILTQQASWRNVELAIGNLKRAHKLSLSAISTTDVRQLERLIRPSGFYRQKADRLKAISSYVISNYGSLEKMFKKDTFKLREELLSLNGIGKETADSIMLYAAGKMIFVIDAYTERIMSRIYDIDIDIGYDKLQEVITGSIGNNLDVYKDFHAQFVELGKNHCRTKPACSGCPVNGNCLYYEGTFAKRR